MHSQDKILTANQFYYLLMEKLANTEKQFFDTQGYLIVRQMAAEAQVKVLRNVAEQQLETVVAPVEYEADVAYPGAPSSRAGQGGNTVRRLLHAYQRDKGFAQWGRHPDLIHTVKTLLNSNQIYLVQAHHNCVMTKHPMFSSSTMWHQDFRYWRFQQNALVTVWLALGQETARNGCMRLIPGSHLLTLDKPRFDQASFLRTDLPENRALMHQALRAELEPGDVLLFHSGLLHAAGRNQTDTPKLALVYSYRAAGNLPLSGTRSAAMPEIELLDVGNDEP